MQISGFFTIDEIQTATEIGARFEQLKGGQKSLTFEKPEDYEKWMGVQRERHPDRWSQLITIKPK